MHKIIQHNNQLTYDSLERIKQVNFPYDFGSPDTNIYVDTVYENVEVDIKADFVSTYDFINNSTRFYRRYDSTCTILRQYEDIVNRFELYVYDPGGPDSDNPPSIIRKLPLIRFNNPGVFHTLSRIDNATFQLYPRNFDRLTGGDTSLNKVNLYIRPLKKLMDETDSTILFTESSLGQYYPAFAFMEDSADCAYYFENNFDVTNMLNTHIYTNNDSVLAFKIDAKPIYTTVDPPEQNYFMDFYPYIGNCNFSTWCNRASPILHIIGVKRTIKRDTILTYQNFSSKFTYDNSEKSVKTELKYNNQSTGKRKSLFDGFYRVRQNRLYTSENDFDSTAVKYNYLSLKLNSKDGRENLTKYSYNQYLNPSKTENPDASYTLVTETYYNGYNYTFGAISGMVVKKVFTDEAGNNFEKYYDAVGNLRREIKYVEGIPSDNPEVELIPHVTDYKYDDLYRVIEVKTPNNKHIYYSYDGLGRQSSRTTPDAGLVKYKYDKNDNLRFSQDNNQANKPTETPPSKQLSYRGYDGLNRLLYLCDSYSETYLVPWSNLNPDDTYYFDSYTYTPNNFLVINVYDTITNYPANANIFSYHKPSDYYTTSIYTNNTKGSLCATAYRTLGTDSMSFKYYRYDARGRVIKMWNYIAGLGMKVTSYEYNSQNQLTKLEYQTESDTDYKRFIYTYDYAGRFSSVSTEESGPPPDYNDVFASYKYNENSQIDSLQQNNFNVTTSYVFNNRNWITRSDNSNELFGYALEYYSNGNIDNQHLFGSYRTNFSDGKEINSKFTYDKSNRLEKIERNGNKYFELTGEYSYDPDGNFLTLTRSYNSDNFSYDYYSGTNRLKKVSGTTEQYTYDYNGNQTNDYFAGNTGISYDHRNLITEITRSDNTTDPPTTIKIRYKYDEAGNRIRKTIYQTQDENPSPITNGDNPAGWTITKDEYYSRDASGKEIAVYQSYNLDYWNVWGTGNEGRIKPTGMKYFYLKDHLGSIRAVINQNNVIVQAQDYDPWGHIARTWDTTSSDYKFTGKEHDKESSYDYFGARYYDSRIGRWGQLDPYYNKYQSFTPYIYSYNCPLKYIDPDGKDAIIEVSANNQIKITLNYVYIKHNKKYAKSLNDEQLNWLNKFEINTEKSWSKEYVINGTKYFVSVEVNLIEVNNPGEAGDKMDNIEGATFIQSDYENILENQPFNYGVGVRSNIMYMSIDNLNPFYDTGAHEAGHLMGLKGEQFGFGIMHHKTKENEFRDVPQNKDFSNIVNFNKLTLTSGFKSILKTYSDK